MALPPQALDQVFPGAHVARAGAAGDLSALHALLLVRQPSVDAGFDGQRRPIPAGRLSPGQQVGCFGLPSAEGGVRIVPRTEVVELTPGLLAPLAVGVGGHSGHRTVRPCWCSSRLHGRLHQGGCRMRRSSGFSQNPWFDVTPFDTRILGR